MTRPGYDKSKLFQDIGEIREKFSSRVHYMEVPALAISSSDIRERAKRGAPIKYLLPQEVEDYIHKFGLYQDDAEDEVKFMLPVETMQEKLQSALSVKRYIHTMGVAEEAVKLAEITARRRTSRRRAWQGFCMIVRRITPKLCGCGSARNIR